MKFTEYFDVALQPEDNWFDPILSIDTRLFIDPFLLYASEEGHFIDSHADIIAFFNSVFKLVARAAGNRTSVLWRKSINSLLLPEVEEICLGYTGAGTRGSGSGPILAAIIVEAIWEAIQAGLEEITHFEEISILREGIGADRISDLTAALIRKRLAAYTQDVCKRHALPVQRFRYARGWYDVAEERWSPLGVDLPRNPYNGRAILLIPRHYLRDLPTVNADDFWDYCWSNENDEIRTEFSHDITKRVSKHEIIAFARRHPEIRQRYMRFREQHPATPYNFYRDPRGLVRWYGETAEYCRTSPLLLQISSESDFLFAMNQMVQRFRHYVQENRGWNLLWNENNTPRREEAAQDLFLGIVKHYCEANDIDISREADIGRGPVDFKVSHGFRMRALLEVKLAKNTRFWNGLEKQLPKYQDAEKVGTGYFIVILYSDQDFQKITDIQNRVKKVQEKTGYQITVVSVDARPNPLSASKL